MGDTFVCLSRFMFLAVLHLYRTWLVCCAVVGWMLGDLLVAHLVACFCS